MKTFYSIIKISPNSAAGDSLSVGLFVRSGNRFWLNFSEAKKRISKSLLSANHSAIDFAIKQIRQKINEEGHETKKRENGLFFYSDSLDISYFSYLSQHTNGLVQFTAPVSLKDEMNDENFKKLYSVLIEKEEPVELEIKFQEKEFKKRVDKKLINRVKDKVHTNQKFDKGIIPSLFFNYEMDVIGKNGSLTGAKAIPFTKSQQTLDAQVSHYIILIENLSKKFQKEKNNNFYLIADEPAELKSPEHKLWESLHSQQPFTLIGSEEAEVVAKKIEDTHATTFL